VGYIQDQLEQRGILLRLWFYYIYQEFRIPFSINIDIESFQMFKPAFIIIGSKSQYEKY
jgi:hypothetical protein